MPVRTIACERARNALNDISFGLYTAGPGSPQGDPQKKIKELEKRIDAAEQGCVTLLFHIAKIHAAEWMGSTQKLLDELQGIDEEKWPETKEQLKKRLPKGLMSSRKLFLTPRLEYRRPRIWRAGSRSELRYSNGLKRGCTINKACVLFDTSSHKRIGNRPKNSGSLSKSMRHVCRLTCSAGSTFFGTRSSKRWAAKTKKSKR